MVANTGRLTGQRRCHILNSPNVTKKKWAHMAKGLRHKPIKLQRTTEAKKSEVKGQRLGQAESDCKDLMETLCLQQFSSPKIRYAYTHSLAQKHLDICKVHLLGPRKMDQEGKAKRSNGGEGGGERGETERSHKHKRPFGKIDGPGKRGIKPDPNQCLFLTRLT